MMSAPKLIHRLEAAGAGHTNATADTALPSGTFTFPANFFQNGKRIDFIAVVRSPTTTGATTLVLKAKFGGTAFVTTTAVDQADGDVAVIKGSILVRDADGSGTAVCEAVAGESDATGTITGKMFAAVIASLDFTAAIALAITATWSAADANSCQLERFEIVEIA